MAEAIYNKYQNTYNYVHQNNFNAANIQFLSGTQSELNKYLLTSEDSTKRGKAKEGTFYLTSDTHRLYIGRSITVNSQTLTVPVPVNEGIETVSDTAHLPTNANQGEFYYIESGNILAVRSGSNWIQLNSDTGISTVSTNVTDQLSNNGTSGYVKVSTVVEDTTGTGVFGDNDADSFRMIPGSNITFTVTPADTTDPQNVIPARLTIAAKDTTYTLGTTATPSNGTGGTIKITPNSGTASSVSLVKAVPSGATDQGDLTITSNANGTVTFTNRELDGIDVSARSGSNNTGFNVIPIVGGQERTFPASDTTHSSILDPQITYGASSLTKPNISSVAGGTTDVKFVNGTATLDVYTRLQTEKVIDDRIKAEIQTADALVYRGTAKAGTTTTKFKLTVDGSDYESNTSSQFSNVELHNGDVFKATENFSIGTQNVKAGDLIIATGTETNGVLGTVTWDIIPSGDEYTYKSIVNTTNKTFEIYPSLGSTDLDNILKVQFSDAGNSPWVSVSASELNNSNTIPELGITYSHKDSTLTSTLGTENTTLDVATANNSSTGSAIEFYTIDTATPFTTDHGHLTNYKYKKIKISHNEVSDINTVATALSTSGTTLKSKVALDFQISELNGNEKGLTSATAANNKPVLYTSETLTITASAGTGLASTATQAIIGIDLTWGTF